MGGTHKKGGEEDTQTLQQSVRSRMKRGEAEREGRGGLIAVNNGEMVCAWGAFCRDHNSSRESQGSAQMPE